MKHIARDRVREGGGKECDIHKSIVISRNHGKVPIIQFKKSSRVAINANDNN